MLALIKSSIGTKFVIRWADLIGRLALDSVRTASADDAGVRTVDIKRFACVEKVPGGEIESSHVLSGVMLYKDIVHPQMRRRDTQAAHSARAIRLLSDLRTRRSAETFTLAMSITCST